jgi:hypothetical protein
MIFEGAIEMHDLLSVRAGRWIAAALLLSVTAGLALADDDPRLEQSRMIVASFAGQLQSELKAAMADGGPAAAIAVCKDVAPAVASRLSRENGAKVGRTSLRVRNPSNLPSDWQSKVLQDFDARASASPEYIAGMPDGRFRYMKGIPTGGVCLACHGNELSNDVQILLDEHYPHDRARGYAPGDIRGAFSVEWPQP